MEYLSFQKVLKEHIEELIRNYKELIPGYDIKEHCQKNGMSYDSFRKMIAGRGKSGQEWRLEYFIKAAEMFNIPPDKLLKDVIRKYKDISKA